VCCPRAGTSPMSGSTPLTLAGGNRASIGPLSVPTGTPTAACAQLLVIPDAVHVIEAAVGNAGRIEPGNHLVGGQADEFGLDQRGQLGPCRNPPGVGVETRIAGQLGPPQDLVAKGLPLTLVLQAEDDLGAIARPVRPVGRDDWMGRALAAWRLAAIVTQIDGLHHPLGQGLEHADLDTGTTTGAPALQQRGEDAAVGVHAGRRCRRSTRPTCSASPGCRSPTGSRTRSGSAGRRPSCRHRVRCCRSRRCRRRSGVDVRRRQGRVAETETIRRAGPEVLHQHVGCDRSSRANISRPSGCLTSSVRLSFERLVHTKCDDRPRTRVS
jgi:hypothetical protein